MGSDLLPASIDLWKLGHLIMLKESSHFDQPSNFLQNNKKELDGHAKEELTEVTKNDCIEAMLE